VDDGSTDQTEEVVRAYAEPRLRYIRQVNQGASAARNAGLGAAGGQFIAFLDSDDRFLPEKLACQMARVDRDPTIGLVYGQYYGTTASGAERKLLGTCDAQIQLQQLLLGPAFHTSTLLIRRSWLEQVGGFDEQLKVGEEWELSLRLALAGCRMVCAPQPVAEVRLQAVSLSRETYRHGKSVTAVLDKIFSAPEMPTELLQSRELFYASLFIRHAVSAYLAADLEAGKDLLKRALFMIDSSLNSQETELLIARFVSHLKGLSLDDPKVTLRSVTEHLPGEKLFADKLKRKLWQKFYLESAFIAYTLGHRLKCVHYSLQAIVKAPSYLRDRGLMSILFRSLGGSWLIEGVKRLQVRNSPLDKISTTH
jgi:glycosyltransferase involved in cell wall biosynthesis